MGQTAPLDPEIDAIVSSGDDSALLVWRAGEYRKPSKLNLHGSAILNMSFSPLNQLIAAGSADGSITLVNYKDLAIVEVLYGHTSKVTSVSFSHGGDC